jgi:hypothetical protein
MTTLQEMEKDTCQVCCIRAKAGQILQTALAVFCAIIKNTVTFFIDK